MSDRRGGLGPVQAIVIAFEGGRFDGKVLDELRRLRAQDAIRLLDLLFMAKDAQGDLTELDRNDLWADGDAASGALVRNLLEPVLGAQNGSSPGRESSWFLADAIPAGSAAAIALIEHRWAIPLRDAIEAAKDHDLVDRWIHRDDLL